jgi:Mrp family chromosome partitioning ATPase
MEEEIKRFDEKLAEERLFFEREHARRREEFVRQLKAKAAYDESQQQAAPAAAPAAAAPQPPSVGCQVKGTELAGKAAKCSSCDLQGQCASSKPQPAPAAAPQQQGTEAGCNVIGTSEAGKADKCAECPSKSQCGSGTKPQDTTSSDIAIRMSFVEHRILVMSGKGGVGKSMLSAQLAFSLANKGFMVGLLDVDICGPTVPKMMGKRKTGVVREANGIIPVKVTDNLLAMSIGFLVEDESEAVIWRGPRKIGLIQAFLKDVEWGALDFLIIDTPPGTSDEHLSTVQLLKATGIDGAVVVTTPQDVSVIEVGKEINFCDRMGVKVLGVVENFSEFVCPLCSAVTEVWPPTSGGGTRLAADHGVPFLGKIPLDPSLSRLGEVGAAFVNPESPTGRSLSAVAESVVQAVYVNPK